MELHLHFLASGERNWRKYINHLSEQLEQMVISSTSYLAWSFDGIFGLHASKPSLDVEYNSAKISSPSSTLETSQPNFHTAEPLKTCDTN